LYAHGTVVASLHWTARSFETGLRWEMWQAQKLSIIFNARNTIYQIANQMDAQLSLEDFMVLSRYGLRYSIESELKLPTSISHIFNHPFSELP
jgi:hypothetical protein